MVKYIVFTAAAAQPPSELSTLPQYIYLQSPYEVLVASFLVYYFHLIFRNTVNWLYEVKSKMEILHVQSENWRI